MKVRCVTEDFSPYLILFFALIFYRVSGEPPHYSSRHWCRRPRQLSHFDIHFRRSLLRIFHFILITSFTFSPGMIFDIYFLFWEAIWGFIFGVILIWWYFAASPNISTPHPVRAYDEPLDIFLMPEAHIAAYDYNTILTLHLDSHFSFSCAAYTGLWLLYAPARHAGFLCGAQPASPSNTASLFYYYHRPLHLFCQSHALVSRYIISISTFLPLRMAKRLLFHEYIVAIFIRHFSPHTLICAWPAYFSLASQYSAQQGEATMKMPLIDDSEDKY